MERAGLEGVVVELTQLTMQGSSPGAKLGRLAAWPLLLARRTLQDSLVAWGVRHARDQPPRETMRITQRQVLKLDLTSGA
jgi:hypothetical protein